MAETIGSLCDKIIVVKLKQYHTKNAARKKILSLQEIQLKSEIDEFIADAINGLIPLNKLTFKANKVFRKKGNRIDAIKGSIGEVFAKLAEVNCILWHEQEKVYAFEKVASEDKNEVVKKLALFNLKRNNCIDEIDKAFTKLIARKDKD